MVLPRRPLQRNPRRALRIGLSGHRQRLLLDAQRRGCDQPLRGVPAARGTRRRVNGSPPASRNGIEPAPGAVSKRFGLSPSPTEVPTPSVAGKDVEGGVAAGKRGLAL